MPKLSEDFQTKLLMSAVIVVAVLVLRFIAFQILNRGATDRQKRYRWRKAAEYVSLLIMVIGVGRVWFSGMDTITTFVGLVGAGLAVALQAPIGNLAGWLLIISRKPFDVGDRIQIGETQGDVIDVQLFHFVVMEIGNWVRADQSTGRVVIVPNVRVFSEPIANYHKGFAFIWVEVPVLVTFESNWRKAKELLQKVADDRTLDMARKAEKHQEENVADYLVQYQHLTPIVYTSVAASGVMLTLRFVCDPRRRRNYEERIWEGLLEKFGDRDDIDFAFPTVRYFDNTSEGKPGDVADSGSPHAIEKNSGNRNARK